MRVAGRLDARLARTRAGTLEFLQVLCEDEIGRRESAALTRRIRRARFEEQVTHEGFDCGHADRTWGARVREHTRPAVLILDDFARREHTGGQADDLYEFISDRAVNHRPLILRTAHHSTGTRPPDPAESLLDRLINTSH